jgi:signal transduction histidine kinase
MPNSSMTLPEPELNSVWIEQREEIYRFFREALNNVIQHAQPPHGTATQVCISLRQEVSAAESSK